MAQLVKHPTLDFGSGHDLAVCGFDPHVRLCTSSMKPAWDSLSPSLSLSAPPPCMPMLSHSLSLKINKLFKKLKKNHNSSFCRPVLHIVGLVSLTQCSPPNAYSIYQNFNNPKLLHKFSNAAYGMELYPLS